MIKNEMVNHPQHYKNNTFECIDIMLDVFGKDKTVAFCELNAFKYLWRSNNKGTDIQEYMDLDGFEEHSSLADCDKFGPSAYFVEEEWLNNIDNE